MQGDTQIGGLTVRRSRVSSIFQQKTSNPDDIDTDFLKHVQFAAQRGSPVSLSASALADDQQLLSASQSADVQPAAEQNTPDKNAAATQVSSAALQPMNIEEFTLDKIEQSIADIEAELGWTSNATGQPVTAPPMASALAEGPKSTTAPASILTTANAHKANNAGQSAAIGTTFPG